MLERGSSQNRRSQSRDKRKEPKNEKGLKPDEKYSAFSTTRELSGLLVLTEKPINGRLINSQLHEPNDIKYFL